MFLEPHVGRESIALRVEQMYRARKDFAFFHQYKTRDLRAQSSSRSKFNCGKKAREQGAGSGVLVQEYGAKSQYVNEEEDRSDVNSSLVLRSVAARSQTQGDLE